MIQDFESSDEAVLESSLKSDWNVHIISRSRNDCQGIGLIRCHNVTIQKIPRPKYIMWKFQHLTQPCIPSISTILLIQLCTAKKTVLTRLAYLKPFSYTCKIQENTEKKEIRIWTLFLQCFLLNLIFKIKKCVFSISYNFSFPNCRVI